MADTARLSVEEKRRRRMEAWKGKQQRGGDGSSSFSGGRGGGENALTSFRIGDGSQGNAVDRKVKKRRVGGQGEEEERSVSLFREERVEKRLETKEVKDEDGDDRDPLDAFMEQVVGSGAETVSTAGENNGGAVRADDDVQERQNTTKRRRRRRRVEDESDGDATEGEEDGLYALAGDVYNPMGTRAVNDEDDEAWARRVRAGEFIDIQGAVGSNDNNNNTAVYTTGRKMSKGEKMGVVDHSQIDYPPFRKNFYTAMPNDLVTTASGEEENPDINSNIKVRGKNVPKPIQTWVHAGLSSRVVDVLMANGCDAPLPIQAQALPVIMSGRDCIGVAKTGSGKTLAFVLPMLRHVKDQVPHAAAETRKRQGPIAIVMAPTRELVTQIGKEVKRYGKPLGLRSTCVYGGSGIANQIADLKRGCEIVVCTPGRMIDILASGTGKITTLRNVTYLVMDEADRMFDMGFEPQIMRIVNNIRPDRQTVLFSATFPKAVEALARKVLNQPIEIQLGGRSVVNSDITQIVEIRPEEERFLRLLQLLGEWYEKGKILVFVSSQDRCDGIFRDLLRAGYPCLSLHGGKDQYDRESTISDFKSNVCNVLVATSVAARGLDVKELVLVINYDCPNHHEEYVHRVGRTGRAGRKGTAVTFISPTDEDQYAPDLVKALTESGAPVPNDLAAMSQGFLAKKKAGLAKGHASGFGGSGFTFSKEEEDKVKALRVSTAAKEYGIIEDDNSDEEQQDDAIVHQKTEIQVQAPEIAAELNPQVQAQAKAAKAIAERLLSSDHSERKTVQAAPVQHQGALSATAAALAAAKAASKATTAEKQPKAATSIQAAAMAAMEAMGAIPTPQFETRQDKNDFYTSELEINDFPQHARWKVTHRATQDLLSEQYGAGLIVKGRYVKPGGPPLQEGERKLYVSIEGPTPEIVKKAKQEIKRILEETTEKVLRREGPQL